MTDRCEYECVEEAFPWLFMRNRPVIISLDIDGIMSALLLNEILGCAVVGIYTLDALWTNSGLIGDNPEEDLAAWSGLFLDHDIYRRSIDSVGHHLLQWSEETPIPEHAVGGGSLNPNLLRGITFKNALQRKYPFSTVHFLLALFGDRRDFAYHPSPMMTTFLMHLDSSFISAMRYQDNALDWLDWLGGSGETSPLYPLCRAILRMNPQRILLGFKDLAKAFKACGLPPRSQLRLSNPNAPEDIRKLTSLKEWLIEQTGWEGDPFSGLDLGRLNETTMDRRNGKPTKREFLEIVPQRPFSYALLGRRKADFNFNWFVGRAPR